MRKLFNGSLNPLIHMLRRAVLAASEGACELMGVPVGG